MSNAARHVVDVESYVFSQFSAVVVLYTIQGVVLTLTVATLPALLVQKASLTEIGALTCAALPYGARYLIAPPFQRFPRVKGGLLTCGVLLGAALIHLAPVAEAALVAGDVWRLFVTFLALVTLVALLELCAERWSGGCGVGTFGLNLGALVAYAGFLTLQDPNVVSRIPWIPRLTLFDVLYGTGCVTFLVCGGIWLLPTKQPDGSYHEAESAMGGALPWVAFLQRLPFLAVECLIPQKLLDKGLPFGTLASIKLLDFVWGIPAGMFVHHVLPEAHHRRAWGMAYYSRIAIAIALTSYLPNALQAPLQQPSLTILVTLMGLCTFTGSILFTLQSLWIEEKTVGRPQDRIRLNGLSQLGSWLPRAAIYFASDWMSHRVCYRLEQSFGDVPCPMSLPFIPSPTDFCTDSGGACLVVRDGFYVVSYTTLGMGILLGSQLGAP